MILRRWRPSITADQSIIALFPYEPETWRTCNSYEHVGQHGPADYGHVIASTRPVPANDPEGIALLAELTAIGYEPVVRQRRVLRLVPRVAP